MEADHDGTAAAHAAGVEYVESDWGDFIVGTKLQLQGLGLAVGLAFPKEPGAPKKLKVEDPRGYAVEIESASWRPGCFFARILFPNWPEMPKEPWPKAPPPPGLTKREHPNSDEFKGTAEALLAAGLVRLDQLPGMPGMRKVCVTILPDGTLPGGAPTANRAEASLPGARRIERAGRSTYRVVVHLDDEEKARRHGFESRAIEAFRAQTRAMRPERLTDYVRGLVEGRAAHGRGVDALAAMGVLHRRQLPAGWRVIEGQRP